MTSTRRSMIIAVLVVALISCARSYPAPKLTIELSDLTLCQGWDAEEPIGFPNSTPSDETRICVCGHLETNQEGGIMLQTIWYWDRSQLLRNPQVFSNRLFLSCIGEDEGFEPGDYIARVIAGKREIGRVEFTVGENQREK